MLGHIRRLAIIVVGLIVLTSVLFEGPVAGEPLPALADNPAISPYWHPRLQQWNDIIVYVGAYRSLDPDLLAAIIWMESSGYANAISPKGAVGLMQIMPKEAGFSWRPTRQELLDPWVNVPWGASTVTAVIRQGQGDIFNAMAAYNGGWEKIGNRGPQRFATCILRSYAQSVAQRHGIEEPWVALFAVYDGDIRGPIRVVNSARQDVYLYGDANRTPSGAPLIPAVAPTAIVARMRDENGVGYDVAVWFHQLDSDVWIIP